MPDMLRIYLPELISDYPYETYEEQLIDGTSATMQIWTKGRIAALLEAVKALDCADQHVVYDGLPPCWIIALAEHALRPAASYHWTKYLGGKDMRIIRFCLGEQNPAVSGIAFHVLEEGDDIYIHVIADDPEAPGHNYDPVRYFETVAPVIPKMKNVYIHASAPTFVILSAEKTYAPISKNVSISFMHDLDGEGHRLYTCCYTTTPDKSLGDTRRLYPDWDERPFFLKRTEAPERIAT